MPFPTRTIALWAALIAASALLGFGLKLAQFPAALLLGPMVAAIVFGVRGAPLRMPKPAFQAAQAMIGCMVAHAITAEITKTLIADGPLILLVVGVTVLAGALVGLILTRLRVLPGTTAAWGSSPGGAAAMVAMAEEYGSDPRLVAFMQYVRVAAVVLSASLVARLLTDSATAGPPAAAEAATFLPVLVTLAVAAVGAGVALWLRLPAGALIGPMLLGAALHATGVASITLPLPILELAYATIGWYVGLRFTRETLRATLHALPGILVATLAVILLCAGWALGLTHLLAIDFLTAFLATSPGGLDSVAIIAVGSKVDVSFVLAVQTLRLFVVLITGPLLAKWIARAVPQEPA
ncbi:AbrB family transcriptional regulator [Methylobacterium sp. WL120]|uniref:AbrB family transcriptional regulator n=1 Tax=Methylobacterium sp. WL120 TaxID=2603887 RepID=UPI0011C91A06|nr:AbrB family transcriptional regulator [Methylobacterium sp. WL120]TXM65013.1 AbrB family transcriptional regulator [Methylobacterium sp. WL120]